MQILKFKEDSRVEFLTKKERFLDKIYNLLPEAKVRIRKNNLLAIIVSMSEKRITELRDEFLELDNAGVELRVSFSITKVEMKNLSGVYESFDLEKELEVDELITKYMFQVDRRIEWVESNLDYREATLNNFQISISLSDKNIQKKTVIRIELE